LGSAHLRAGAADSEAEAEVWLLQMKTQSHWGPEEPARGAQSREWKQSGAQRSSHPLLSPARTLAIAHSTARPRAPLAGLHAGSATPAPTWLPPTSPAFPTRRAPAPRPDQPGPASDRWIRACPPARARFELLAKSQSPSGTGPTEVRATAQRYGVVAVVSNPSWLLATSGDDKITGFFFFF
jgi:hypothetical protein